MASSKWFAASVLKVETFYMKYGNQIGHLSQIGRTWGTNVEDLKSPIGVAGRVFRSFPDALSFVRSFAPEANATYAEQFLAGEYPFVVLGSEDSLELAPLSSERSQSQNLNSRLTSSLLRGIGSLLGLKTETRTLFKDESGKLDLTATVLTFLDGTVLSIMNRENRDYSPLFAPLRSNRSKKEALDTVEKAFRDAGFSGISIEIPAGENGKDLSFDSCTISRISTSEELVVGTEFSNNFETIADRIRRFEEAGYRRNLMLLGPPGCGKTSLAKQIARRIGRFTVNVDSVFLGTSLVTTLTSFFPKMILICDDFDRFSGDTQKLLASLERTGSSLIVTCNTVYGFDKAAIRVGRIDEIIDVPKPDDGMRARLLRHFLLSEKGDETDLGDLVRLTDGFTPAELREVVKCYRALSFEDCGYEIERIRRQSKLAEQLLFRLDWTGMTDKQREAVTANGFISGAQVRRTDPDLAGKEAPPGMVDDSDDFGLD